MCRSVLFTLCSIAAIAVAQDTTTAPSATTDASSPADTPTSNSSSGSSSSSSSWSGCIDPSNPGALVRIGEPTTVCLQIGNSVAWNAGVEYVRLPFQPQADQYSRFHVPRSYEDLVPSASDPWSGNNITVGVASQQQLSFLRVYADRTNSQVYPYLTAIIDVDKGRVQGITWDDACVFCGGFGACVEITYDYNGNMATQESSGQPTQGCYISEEQCNENLAALNTACDLTLYVVWTGTDANGNALLSSAYRFSVFPPQEIKDSVTQNLPQVFTD